MRRTGWALGAVGVVLAVAAVICDSSPNRPQPPPEALSSLPRPVRTVKDIGGLPAWAVRYGEEPWRLPPPRDHQNDGALTLPARVSLGDIVDRVRHAFERPQPNEAPSARADSYRATATQLGITFSPHRPAAAGDAEAHALAEPDTFVTLATASVQAGGATLAAPQHGDRLVLGNTVQSQLGGGLVEHCEARGAGLELSWYVPERPGSGDLQIALNVGGLAYAGESAAGHHYKDTAGVARVRVGHATLVDAAGLRTAVATTATPRGVMVTVSAALLESAKFPVAIDPLVSPEFGMDNPVQTQGSRVTPAVAGSESNYLVVWQDTRADSADVYGTLVDLTGEVLHPYGLSIATGAGSQTQPKVGILGASTYWVVWTDTRLGNYDIYGARVSASGALIDADGVRISQAAGTQLSPAIACSTIDCAVLWRDDRAIPGAYQISCVTVNSSGALQELERTLYSGNAGAPGVASNGSRYLAAWSRPAGTSHELVAARVETTCILSSAVTSLATAVDSRSPALTGLAGGADYLVAWQNPTGIMDVHGRTVTDGMALGLVLPIAVGKAWEGAPAVASHGGEFVAVWEELRSGVLDIYGRRIGAAGTFIGSSFAVSSGLGEQRFPSIGASPGSGYFVAWQDARRTVSREIYGARITAAGEVADPDGVPVFTVDNEQQFPDIAWNGSSFLVVWQDSRNSEWDIYGVGVSPTGEILQASAIPICTAPGQQYGPSVAALGGTFLVAWEDRRNGSDVYGARVAPDFSVLEPAGVAISTAASAQTHVDVASNKGTWLVVWRDLRNMFVLRNRDDVYAAQVDKNGSVLQASGIAIATGAAGQSDPVVAAYPAGGDFFVVWTEQSAEVELRGVRVSSTGVVLDKTGVAITTAPGVQSQPSLATRASDEYFVVWADTRGGVAQIMGRGVRTAGGVSLADEVTVGSASAWLSQPAVTWDGSAYLVAWVSANESYDVSAQYVAGDGALAGDTMSVASDAGDETYVAVAPGGLGQVLVGYRGVTISHLGVNDRVTGRWIRQDGDGDGFSFLDCNDRDTTIYPGAPESCDAIDSNCNRSLVDQFPDFDNDRQPDCIDPDDDNDGDPDVSDCAPLDPSMYASTPTPPTGQVTAPLAGAVVWGCDVWVEGVVDDPSVQVSVNGEPALLTGAWFSHLTALHAGANTIAVCLTDLCSNAACTSVAVLQDAPELCDGMDNDCDGVVDNGCEPRVTILNPGDNGSTTAPVRVVVAFADTGGDSPSARVHVDGGEVTSQFAVDANGASATLDLAPGFHELTVVATNDAGAVGRDGAHFVVVSELDGAASIMALTSAEPMPRSAGADGRFPIQAREIELLGTAKYAELLPFADELAGSQFGVDAASHAATARMVDFEARGRGGLNFKLERVYSTNDLYLKTVKPLVDGVLASTLAKLPTSSGLDEMIDAVLLAQADQWRAILLQVTYHWCQDKRTKRGSSASCPGLTMIRDFDIDENRPTGSLLSLLQQMLNYDYSFDYTYECVSGCSDWIYCFDPDPVSCRSVSPVYAWCSCDGYPCSGSLDGSSDFVPLKCDGQWWTQPITVSHAEMKSCWLPVEGACFPGHIEIVDADTPGATCRPMPKAYLEVVYSTVLELFCRLSPMPEYNSELQLHHASQRHFQIHSGLSAGWSFNLPFIEMPDRSLGRLGYVHFDGYRPGAFSDPELALFPSEQAILRHVGPAALQLLEPPSFARRAECLANPFMPQYFDLSCLTAWLDLRVTQMDPEDTYLFTTNLPLIGGVLREDIRYKVSQRDIIYYFNDVGQLRFITDPTHLNYVEVAWATVHASNADALENGRIDRITDAAGNIYVFTYMSDEEVRLKRVEWALANDLPVVLGLPPGFYLPAPPLVREIECLQTGERVQYDYEIHDPYAEYPGNNPSPTGSEQVQPYLQWDLTRVAKLNRAVSPEEPSTAASELVWSFGYTGLEWLKCSGYGAPNTGVPYCGRTLTPIPDYPVRLARVPTTLLAWVENPYGARSEFRYRPWRTAPQFEHGQGLPIPTYELDGRWDAGFVSSKRLYEYLTKPPEVAEIWRTPPGGVPEQVSTHGNTRPSRLDPDVERITFTNFGFTTQNLSLERINDSWLPVERSQGPRRETLEYDPAGNVKLITTRLGSGETTAIEFIYPASPTDLGLMLYSTPLISRVLGEDGTLLRQLEFSYETTFPWLLTGVSGDSRRTSYSYRRLLLGYFGTSLKPLHIREEHSNGLPFSTFLSYDDFGNLQRVENAEHEITDFTYHEVNGLPSVFLDGVIQRGDEREVTSTFRFNTVGKLEYARDSRGNEQTIHYDGLGRVDRLDTQAEHFAYAYALRSDGRYETRVSWAPAVDPAATQPLVTVVANSYGELANKIDYREDENGASVGVNHDFRFDRREGWLRWVGIAGRPETKMAMNYDGLGRVTSVINRFGATGTITYDDNLTTREIGALEQATRRVVVTPPGLGSVEHFIDALGRTVARRSLVDVEPQAPSQESLVLYGWDARNRLLWVKSPLNTVTHNEYDSLDRLTRRVMYRVAGNALPGAVAPACDVGDSACTQETFEYDRLHRVRFATNARGHRTEYRYDDLGRLHEEIDPLGVVTTYSRDSAGNLESLRRLAQTVRYTYDHRNLVSSIEDAENNRVALGRDVLGAVTSVTHADTQHTRRYFYDPLGNLRALIDEEGHRFTWLHDEVTGLLAASSEPRGPVADVQYGYDRPTRSWSACDSRQVCLHRTLDAAGRVIDTTIDGLPYVVSRVAYNALGLVKTVSTNVGLPSQGTHQFIYDVDAQLIATVSAEGRRTNNGYDFLGRLVERSLGEPTAPREVWRLAYDKSGNTALVTNPMGGTVETRHDELERPWFHQVSGEAPATFAYSPDERIITATDPNGRFVVSELDGNGDLVKVVDQEGFATEYGYTSKRQLETVVRYDRGAPARSTYTRLHYYPTGRLQAVETPLGATQYFYDPSGNIEREVDAMNLATRYFYDEPHSLPTRVTTPGSGTIRIERDNLLRTTRQIWNELAAEPRLTEISYDDALRQVTTRRGEGGPDTYVLDRDGLVASLTRPGAGPTRFHGYDHAGRLTLLENTLGVQFGYVYDGLGNLTEKWIWSPPDGPRVPGCAQATWCLNGETSSYSHTGKLAAVTDANGVTTFAYRPTDGLLDTVAFHDGATHVYDYFDNGWLKNLAASDGIAKAYDYDHLGLALASESGPYGNSSVVYERDLVGRVIGEAGEEYHDARYYPNGLVRRIDNVHYVRDPNNGRLTCVVVAPRDDTTADPLVPDANYGSLCFDYNEFGEPERMTATGGFTEGYHYYPSGRLRDIDGPAVSRIFEYHPDGLPKRVLASYGASTEETTYGYDSEGRLTSIVSPPLGSMSYDFDAAGNLDTVRRAASVIEARSFDWSNQLATRDTGLLASVEHDARGNVRRVSGNGMPAQTFSHDLFGRLQQVLADGAPVQHLTYDAVDRLVHDYQAASGLTRTVSHFGRLTTAVTELGATQRFVPETATGLPLAMFGQGAYTVPTWQFGVVAELSDDAGLLLDRQVREPYGALVSGDADAMPLGFKGYYQHAGSNLLWTLARSYAAGARSFLGPDPLGGTPYDPMSMNRNRAFRGDPVSLTDFLGFADVAICKGPDDNSCQGSYGSDGGALETILAVLAALAGANEALSDGGSNGSGSRPASPPANLGPRESLPYSPPSLPSMPGLPSLTAPPSQSPALTPGVPRLKMKATLGGPAPVWRAGVGPTSPNATNLLNPQHAGLGCETAGGMTVCGLMEPVEQVQIAGTEPPPVGRWPGVGGALSPEEAEELTDDFVQILTLRQIGGPGVNSPGRRAFLAGLATATARGWQMPSDLVTPRLPWRTDLSGRLPASDIDAIYSAAGRWDNLVMMNFRLGRGTGWMANLSALAQGGPGARTLLAPRSAPVLGELRAALAARPVAGRVPAGQVGAVSLGGGKAAGGTTTVIGRTKDLQSLAKGERSLLDRLRPDLGSPKANWARNSGVLREEMRRGLPIRDASPGDTGGAFLNAERALLRDRGWMFDPATNYWMPPVP